MGTPDNPVGLQRAAGRRSRAQRAGRRVTRGERRGCEAMRPRASGLARSALTLPAALPFPGRVPHPRLRDRRRHCRRFGCERCEGAANAQSLPRLGRARYSRTHRGARLHEAVCPARHLGVARPLLLEARHREAAAAWHMAFDSGLPDIAHNRARDVRGQAIRPPWAGPARPSLRRDRQRHRDLRRHRLGSGRSALGCAGHHDCAYVRRRRRGPSATRGELSLAGRRSRINLGLDR